MRRRETAARASVTQHPNPPMDRLLPLLLLILASACATTDIRTDTDMDGDGIVDRCGPGAGARGCAKDSMGWGGEGGGGECI